MSKKKRKGKGKEKETRHLPQTYLRSDISGSKTCASSSNNKVQLLLIAPFDYDPLDRVRVVGDNRSFRNGPGNGRSRQNRVKSGAASIM